MPAATGAVPYGSQAISDETRGIADRPRGRGAFVDQGGAGVLRTSLAAPAQLGTTDSTKPETFCCSSAKGCGNAIERCERAVKLP
jgi:hypothetical protein